MQKTVRMWLNNKQYDITVIYVTYFQMPYYLMHYFHYTEHELPQHLQRSKLYIVIF